MKPRSQKKNTLCSFPLLNHFLGFLFFVFFFGLVFVFFFLQVSEVAHLKEGSTLVSMIYPAQNAALVDKLMEKKGNVIGLDCVPRISRAQAMDVLSSMSNISG